MGVKKHSKGAQRECFDPTGHCPQPGTLLTVCRLPVTCFRRGLCSDAMLMSLRGCRCGKPAPQCSRPAPLTGWLLTGLQSSFTWFSLAGSGLSQALSSVRAPKAPVCSGHSPGAGCREWGGNSLQAEVFARCVLASSKVQGGLGLAASAQLL